MLSRSSPGRFYLAAGYSDEYLFAYLAKGLFASPWIPMKMNYQFVTMPAEAALEKRLQANFMMEKPWLHFLAMPYIKSMRNKGNHFDRSLPTFSQESAFRVSECDRLH